LGEINVIPVGVNVPKCRVERMIHRSDDSIWAYQALVCWFRSPPCCGAAAVADFRIGTLV
jgi:hypothetical protein